MMNPLELQIALASTLLACIAILVALSAIFAFINIKSKAASIAQKEAKRIAEKAACDYLQTESPALIREHLETFTNGYTLSPTMGNDIAGASI